MNSVNMRPARSSLLTRSRSASDRLAYVIRPTGSSMHAPTSEVSITWWNRASLDTSAADACWTISWSRAIAEMPTTRPRASRIGASVTDRIPVVPSLRHLLTRSMVTVCPPAAAAVICS